LSNEKKTREVWRPSLPGKREAMRGLTMHRIAIARLTVVAVVLVATLLVVSVLAANTDYDIAEVYGSAIPAQGTVVLTTSGDIEDIDVLLSETELDIGRYSVTVTRKAQDLYKIDGFNIYVKTRYCYEYSYSQDAILDYDSQAGYTKGTLTFED